MKIIEESISQSENKYLLHVVSCDGKIPTHSKVFNHYFEAEGYYNSFIKQMNELGIKPYGMLGYVMRTHLKHLGKTIIGIFAQEETARNGLDKTRKADKGALEYGLDQVVMMLKNNKQTEVDIPFNIGSVSNKDATIFRKKIDKKLREEGIAPIFYKE